MEEEDTQCTVIKHNSAPVKSVDFSCDSRLIVTGSDDKTVKIISVADKKLVGTLTSHTNWVKCVRFSQDAKLIASASDDKTVKLWDVNKRILNYTFNNVHNGVINAVRFHPDNSLIGTACFDKKVRLFDVRSKQLVQVYDQHKKPVTSLAFHPQGVFLASTSFDETVKIFDLRNGKILYTLTGHEGASCSVNFSQYGDYLATGGSDALIILWKTNLNIDSPSGDYYTFPLDNDSQIQPQSSENVLSSQNKSTVNKQTYQPEGTLNYKNVNNVHPYNESLTLEQTKENISEELSKVFEKMVNQLELITK
jgi:centriolar protein POC1